MANGTATATPQQQTDTDPVRRLYETVKKTNAIKGVPDFETFKQDAQSLEFQRNIHGALQQTGAIKGLPEFETFQKDFFGEPTPGPADVPEGPTEAEPEGEDPFASIRNRRRNRRISGFKNRAEKLNRKAQRLEKQALSNAIPIPGRRSRKDPTLMKEATKLREERNRLLELADAGEQTILDEQDTGQGRLSSATNSFVQGLAQTLGEDTLKSAGIIQGLLSKKRFTSAGVGAPGFYAGPIDEPTDPRDTELYKLGQQIGDAVRETFPTNPKFQKEFLASVLPQGAGSMAAFLAGGVVSKGLKIGSLGAGALGGMTIGSNEFDRALQDGADLDTAFDVFLLNLPVGATEMIPIARMFKRLDRISGGGAKQVLKDGFTGGVEEFIQETTQQTLSNATGQALVDKTRSLFEGALEGGAAGFVLGSLMNGAARGISNARRKAKTEEEKRGVRLAEEIMNQAREDIGSVEITEAPGGTIRNPAEVSFDPEAAPADQLEQLQGERARLETEMERAEAAGESTEDFEAVLSRVDESIGLLQEQIDSGQSAPQQNQQETAAEPAEAQDLESSLNKVFPDQDVEIEQREGGRTVRVQGEEDLDSFAEIEETEDAVTIRGLTSSGKGPQFTQAIIDDALARGKEFRSDSKIVAPLLAGAQRLEQQGYEVEYAPESEQQTVEGPEGEQIITKNEEPVFRVTAPPQQQVPGANIGQEITGELQGEFSEEGLSMAARNPETGEVFVAPRNEAPTHINLLDRFELDPDNVEMGFVSPSGKFLNRNQGLEYQQAIEPEFQPTAPGVVFAEEVNPQQGPQQFTSSDEQFNVEPAEQGITVTDIESGQELSEESPKFPQVAGEYFAQTSSDEGAFPRNPNQNDIQYLRSVAENSRNPIQLADAMEQAQELQEGTTDSPLQSSIRESFKEATGVDLSPQLAEAINRNARQSEQTDEAADSLAALRGEQQGLTRKEMGAAATPGTGGSPLTGAGRRTENLNEEWVNDPQPLSEIVDDLVKSVGLTLREGRMSLKQALGQYSLRSGVTRVKVRKALEVVAHEAGHDIDDNFTKEIKTLTDLHADEIAPLAYPQAAPNQKISEGFAEFFRLYITNPGYAEGAAPNFYADFQSWMKDLDNNMFGDFERIRGAYQAFLNQPSDKAVESGIVQSPTRGEEITRKLKDEGVGSVIKNKLGQFYRAAVGEDDILRLARNKLLDIHFENTGETLDISPLMDFYKLNRISLDAYSAGAMDIEYGVENYNSARAEGASLRDALAVALGKDWSDTKRKQFSAYLVSRRATQEWDRFFADKIPNRPTELTKKDHELNIKAQEAANPEFVRAADMVQEYTRNLWKKLRDSGLITNEAYQNGLEEHEFYVPFFRDMSRRTNVGGEGTSATGKNTVIKAFRGSDEDILDPIESIMKMTYEYNMLIKSNDVKVALLKMAHTAGSGAGAIAEEIPNQQVRGIPINTEEVIKQLSDATDWSAYGVRDAMGQLLQLTSLDNVELPDLTFFKQGEINEKGEPIVFAWQNGQRRAIRLADQEFGMEMYKVLTNQHSAAAEMTVNALSYPASWLRTGVTTEPSFFIANLIRDQVSAWILTDVGFKPFGSIVKDLTDRGKETAARSIAGFSPQLASSEAADQETQQEYSRLYRTFSGISTFNVAALDENRAKQEVKKLKQKNIPLRRLESVRGLNELLDLSEIGTRLGVFQRAMRRAKERGLTQKEAAVEAGFLARDLIDFGRHGSKLSATRRLLPFFNAAIQGLDKGGRVLSAEGNLWRAITPYFKDYNGRPLNEEEKGQVRLAQKAWLKTMEIATIGASLGALYWDDPEYDEIPDYLKNTHWIFKNPVMTDEAQATGLGEWVAVPKPFELAFLSNTAESLINSYANEDPEWAQEWLKSIWEVTAPPISPIGIQVPAEVWANKRKFDGRPIVYDRLLGREAWQQYNSYTSGFGKWMGKQINVSPAVIDHIVTGTTGSWGRVLLQATTQSRPGAPAGGWEDTWVARRFMRSADRGNKSSKAFWNQIAPQEGELTSTMGSFRYFFESGAPAEAFEYFDKQEPYEKIYIAMQYVDKENQNILPILDQPHPLDNARKTSSVISNMRTDLIESQGVFAEVSSDDKRSMDDLLDRLATVEYRNALISSGHPKWKDREPLDFNKVLNRIRSDFPILHQEMVGRYTEAKRPMNPQQSYDRFQQYTSTPQLTDKLLPIVQLQRQQLEQQLGGN